MQFIHRGLLASILLVAPLSYGAAQQEKFDNNFIAKDLFIIPQKQCSDQRMQEIIQSSRTFIKQNFSHQQVRYQVDPNNELMLITFIDLTAAEFQYYSDNKSQFSQYRLLLVLTPIEFEPNSCHFIYAVSPEAWTGKQWLRFKSNGKLDRQLFKYNAPLHLF